MTFGLDTLRAKTLAVIAVLVMAPVLESQRYVTDLGTQPYGLCDVGHQGLIFDKEFGLYYNRARMLHPVFGRFGQRV